MTTNCVCNDHCWSPTHGHLPIPVLPCTALYCLVYCPQGYKKAGQYQYMLDNIKWVTDYFIKCIGNGKEIVVQVGPCFRSRQPGNTINTSAHTAEGLVNGLDSLVSELIHTACSVLCAYCTACCVVPHDIPHTMQPFVPFTGNSALHFVNTCKTTKPCRASNTCAYTPGVDAYPQITHINSTYYGAGWQWWTGPQYLGQA